MHDAGQPRPTSSTQPLRKDLRWWHYAIVALTILCTSFQSYYTTVYTLRHSRHLQRAFNLHLLEHDSLEIYWFGYRIGQMLINYPIHEYYELEDVAGFLDRLETMLANMDVYVMGDIDQQAFNQTAQTV